MKIIIDLDGTLIDSRERLYRLFQYLVPVSSLSFDEYWNYKRNKIDHQKILLEKFYYTPEDFAVFKKEWMNKIEIDEWLQFDKPFEGVTDYLAEMHHHHQLFLATARQSEELALRQIQQFKWAKLFTKIFITGGKLEKYDLINQSLIVTQQDWIIGDTGKDIQVGKQLGIKTAAVLSGFLNKEKLLEYEPDLIINTILDFKHN